MKKASFLAITLLLLFVPCLKAQVWDGKIASSFAGGTGTETDPYQIANGGQLAYLAQQVNAGNNYRDTYFKLTADIRLNNETDWSATNTTAPSGWKSWTPIGDLLNQFDGIFDGCGYTIYGLRISGNNSNGLFGYIDDHGIIKNLGVYAGVITTGSNLGGIAGENRGEISNCYNTCTIIGSISTIGGIVGYNYGTVNNCYNTGTVEDKATGGKTGGVVGYNRGIVSNCYHAGKVISSGTHNIGGIAGSNIDNISNCYYLSGTAPGGISNQDVEGEAEVISAEKFASGEICWRLNGSTDKNSVWFQNLGTDDLPVLDNTHGTVYAFCECPSSQWTYSNNGPTSIGIHTDSNNDGYCDFCERIQTSKPIIFDNVYQINNRAELYWFSGLINGTLDDGTPQNSSAQALLTADILLNDTTDWATWDSSTPNLLPWTPIGSQAYFSGIFNGDGHNICGIYINSTEKYQGLFGLISSDGGKVENIHVMASYIKGESNNGGIAGKNYGTINNCSNSGSINGQNFYNGGIAGENYGTINHCYNTGPINDKSNGSDNGGIVGSNDDDALINECYNIGAINGRSNNGGIAGNNSGRIDICYNAGIISDNGSNGSLVGTALTEATINKCYYLDGTADDFIGFGDGEATRKTADEFANGEVCWLLQNMSNTASWGQTLGIDKFPTWGNNDNTVYKLTLVDDATTTDFYANSGSFSLPVLEDDGKSGNWYTAEDGGEEVEDNSVLTSDMTLYAQWYESPETGLDKAPSETWCVIGMERKLLITGTDSEATVYDVFGKLIYRGTDREIDVPSANVYIIYINNERIKVIVR